MGREEPRKIATDEPAAAMQEDAVLRELLLGYCLKRSWLVIQAKVQKSLDAFSLRPAGFSALVLICARPEMTQSQLASALSLERSNIVLIIDDLEERGLIVRNRVEGDRRAYALNPTLAGMRFRDRVVKLVSEAEASLFDVLSSEEKEQLASILARIEKAGTP
ncbi:MAG: MarR family transcriptional regulator [Rhizobiaceae bacterium]